MPTIYSKDADGQERYDTVAQERVAMTIKKLRRAGKLQVYVIPNKWKTLAWLKTG